MSRALFRRGASLAAVILIAFALTSCDWITGGGVGTCVSDVVSYSFGDQVYCYDGWDESECDAYDADNVNGASWTFHGGQTCADRGLSEGSNSWP